MNQQNLPSTQDSAPRTVFWRRIFWLQFWLVFIPPVGWWMVWNEPSLSPKAKGRLVVYTYLIPFVVYFALTVFILNSVQNTIDAAGGGY